MTKKEYSLHQATKQLFYLFICYQTRTHSNLWWWIWWWWRWWWWWQHSNNQ